jgi:shikimate kinase
VVLAERSALDAGQCPVSTLPSRNDRLHIFLIGFRGSGKSTVGQILADLIPLPYYDLDQIIQARSGRNVAEIFREDGESAFREWETSLLSKVTMEPPAVISLGGGACQSEQNRTTIKLNGRAVWLRADPETLWHRIECDPRSVDLRPALTQFDGLEEVQRLLELRESNYAACADYVINTGSITPPEAASEIARWWLNADK